MSFQLFGNWQRIDRDRSYVALHDIFIMVTATCRNDGALGSIVCEFDDAPVAQCKVHVYSHSNAQLGQSSFTIPVPKGQSFKLKTYVPNETVDFIIFGMIADISSLQPSTPGAEILRLK